MTLYRGTIAFDPPDSKIRKDAGTGARSTKKYRSEQSLNYRANNREHVRAYMRGYMRKYRLKKKFALDEVTFNVQIAEYPND